MTIANILSTKFGLHPPKELTSSTEMTPRRLKLITVLVMTGVFRFTFILLSNLYSIPAYLLLMTVLKPLRRHAHDFYWYIEGVLFRWLQLLVAWWMWSGGYSVQECGDDVTDLEHTETLVLTNHQSTADVPALMYAFLCHGQILDRFLWVMDVLFKNSNFGFVSQMHGDFFIQQGKETRHLQPVLLRKHLLEKYLPRKRQWIVIFPEGGFFWKQKKSSQEYGKKNGFPHLEHCLLPRAGAVQTILETLNRETNVRPIKWFVDITVAYPQGCPLNFQTIIIGQRDPMVTTIHYRKYPISQVPLDGTELRDWMFQLYSEKDHLLDAFYKTGKFPASESVDKSYRVEPKRLELSIEKIVFINVFFLLLTYLEYYIISSCFQAVLTVLAILF